jgi:outer membrane protein OmpA-like peptidoglycan-associated protein
MPPSYPSASRQLAPFEFSVETARPENLFGADTNTGAKDWPAWLNLPQAKPSRDWPGNLGLASLSVPGLVFDTKSPQQLLSKRTDFTGAQLLYSLPYTEEINALAQLPKEEKQENNNQPEEAIDKPVLIPRRESYAEHWQQLAEKAALAKGDADEVLELKAGKTNVINLVEPFAWPVKATLELDSYPGKIDLANAQGDQSIPLKDEDALKGISGRFAINQRELKLVKPTEPGITVTAGSMSAFGDGKRLRDQRGWWRSAATADNASGIIRTPLQRQTEQDENFVLCTLSTPVSLSFVTGAAWQCWFRDLPFKADTFNREDEAQGAEDVNDTNAVSSGKNALRGYEWRLMQQTGEPLKLLGFYFFPLTLEKVIIQANEVQSVDIIGRIQLPFPQHKQQLPELGNVVKVKFVRTAGSLKIQSVSSTLQGGTAPQEVNGIWSLDPQKDNFAPRLHWKIFEYTATANKIDIDCLLEFYLFGERWFVPLEGNDFEPGTPAAFQGRIGTGADNISMSVAVKLKADLIPDAAGITMQFTWGDAGSLNAVADVSFDLLTTEFAGNVIDLLTTGIKTNFFWNVPNKPALKINKGWLDHRSLQLSFSGFKNNAHKTLELLPGMLLDDVSGEPSAGFASAHSFATISEGNKVLTLNHACVEAVFNCRWGAGPLSSASPAATAEQTVKEVFGSSCGNLNAGYTLNYSARQWTASFLLNGMIDVNNLVSYPRSALSPEMELPVILFDSNSDVIKQGEEPKLRKVAEQMKLSPGLNLSIEGHTDNVDAARDNLQLSRKRATAVKSKLKTLMTTEFGIPAAEAEKRLSIAWFGETLPEATNLTETGKAANRRAEIHSAFTALPAVRPAAGAGDFNHIRHTLRILLNQHEVNAKALTTGSGPVLFKFKDDAAWQFLAVVEHRLTDVTFKNLSTPLQQGNDRRWTAIQEIRFASPAKFSRYVSHFLDRENRPEKKLYSAFPGSPSKKFNEELEKPEEILSIDAHEFSRISAAFHYKPFIEKLLTETGGQNELTKLNNAILVEASAIQKILNRPNTSNEPLNLQYLPGGIQRAILSVPDDYAMPSITPRADWALLSLPFLGRLQQAANDWTGNEAQPASLLAADPILFLHKNIASAQPLPVVPLSLASRGDKKPVPVQVSLFDLTRFRRFRRLDPATLMESWFRIQNPPAETVRDPQKKLVSVTAALPADSPARLSRETLLKRLYHEQRNVFPPAISQLLNEAPDETSDFVWRRSALITWQGFSNIIKEDIHDRSDGDTSNNPYSFYFAAAQIHSYRFTGNGKTIDRYPAVTLLPANLKVDEQPNKMPVSFAVSPYLGLDFKVVRDAATDRTPVLIFAELLCLDQTGKTITPAGSRVWQQEEIIANDNKVVEAWGIDLRNRIAADSPVAVVRIRKVFSSGKEPGMRFPEIEYAFEVLGSGEQFNLIAESGGPLRLSLKQLRFPEGQFGGSIAPSAINSFEIAPPQVTGVQPLYIDKEKWNSVNDDRKWHWGLSALRMSVKFTDKNKGIIGSDLKQDHRLWWNAVSHQVQYEDFRNATPVRKFLPAKFRARYISTLLPVPATPPLPENFKQLPAEIGPIKQWQPVLPGGLYYLFVGARPGVPFVFRNMLIRQDLDKEGENKNDSTPLVAGGIAVQHRFPRPVALPENPQRNQLTEPAPHNALQTWAWYFEPQLTGKHLTMPHDNAFVVKENTAHGLQVSIPQLVGGILPESHDGRFRLQLESLDSEQSNWSIRAELVVAGKQLALSRYQLANDEFYAPDENREKGIEKLRQFLSDLPHGTAIQLRVTVTPKKVIIGDIDDYGQALVLPLRLARLNKLREPFIYQYTQFEDPEYNRRLASQAAQTNREVTYKLGSENKKTELIFAADRREYNATSEGLLALFADRGIKVKGKITFKWINSSGISTDIETLNIETSGSTEEKNGAVLPFSLLDLQEKKSVRFAAGDSLVLLLDGITITASGSVTELQPLGLKVEIVSMPVTPVPAAAYGLLRRKKGAQPVECVKFAWSPQPSRIELLTPMDLKKGIVRRRAVFQWIDTVRLGAAYEYEIQKITPSGSTHFNLFKTTS